MTEIDSAAATMPEAEPKLIGGNLSLDFANSLDSWGDSYPRLVAWAAGVGIIDEDTAARLLKAAKALPTQANQVLEQALKLRELIYNLFSALSGGRPVAPGDLALFNQALSRVREQLELVVTPGGFEWNWKKGGDEPPHLDQVLWPVTRSAADLLTGKELDRVKECPGQDCGRLFVDLSRNRSRRWCDMDHCGMLVKSRKHYAKIRQTRLVP